MQRLEAARARSGQIPFLIPFLIPKARRNCSRKFTERIVSGHRVCRDGAVRAFEPPLRIQFFPDGAGMPSSEFVQVIRTHGKTLERQPGIQIDHEIAPEDGVRGALGGFLRSSSGGQTRHMLQLEPTEARPHGVNRRRMPSPF